MNTPSPSGEPRKDATRTSQLHPHSDDSRPARPRRRRTAIVITLVAGVLLGGVWWVNHRQAAQLMAGAGGGGGGRGGGRRGGFGFGGSSNAPLPVAVRAVEKGDIHLYLDALGTVTPSQVATIRTQISGQLQQVAFKEGQSVQAGDLLAVIDPRPFQNSLAQAEAQLQQAQSQLHTAELDLERYEKLAKEDSIAKQQVDTTRSQVNQFKGLVAAAEAAIATANLNLTYCHVKAPFDGRVGLRLVDSGNYVTPGDASGLVVLSQVKPITAVFTLPEDNIRAVAARLRSGATLKVEAYDRSQTKMLATGTLLTVDNQIDPATGTFKLRAEFSNDDESLFPNQFVNVHLLLDTIPAAAVVPTSAVERGQHGTFVYVVDDETLSAVARPIQLGAMEGERVAVTSGLTAGEKIVIDGADKLRDGQKVILNAGEGGPPGRGMRGGSGDPSGEGRRGGKRGGKKNGGGGGDTHSD